MNLKQLAAEHAVQHITSHMILGLGTGSTVQYVLTALSQRLNAGSLQGIVGVPTSEATAQQARQFGIPLATLEEHPELDVTIDGADQVDRELNLIKGLGGALLREKIVAMASKQVWIVVDESKRTNVLGDTVPLPIEVLPFGWSTHRRLIEGLGGTATLRTMDDGRPFITDNGNYMLHCVFPEGIQVPSALSLALKTQPGIVEHGLFLGIASTVYVGTPDGVVTLERPMTTADVP